MGEVHHLRPGQPDAELAMAAELGVEVIGVLRALPGWSWLVRAHRSVHHASVSTADYVPMERGAMFAGIGKTPAQALREARMAALRAGANAVRPDGRA